MTESLGTGSGRPNVSRKLLDATVAGVATRTVTTIPTDADWGDETPPDGIFCFDASGMFLYFRAGGTWYSMPLDVS